MKYLMRFVMGAMLVVGLQGCGRDSSVATEAQVDKPNANVMPQGVIKLAENPDGGGKSCSIPMSSQVWNLDHTPGCNGDDYSYFMLDNVPSAALIRLESDFSCPKQDTSGNAWWFELETIKHPTTTIWISIASLKQQPDGKIIYPGLRLNTSYYRRGDLVAELECLEIEMSDLP